MATSGKVQAISTKYFMCINWGHYVKYLQNKFERLILWPGGAYTDDTYATKPESRSRIRIHFVNHDCIGSLWQSQMSQKPWPKLSCKHISNFFEVVRNVIKNSAGVDEYISSFFFFFFRSPHFEISADAM